MSSEEDAQIRRVRHTYASGAHGAFAKLLWVLHFLGSGHG